LIKKLEVKMLTQTNRWVLFLSITLFLVLFVMMSLPVRASAWQAAEPVSSNSCLTCHEDQYYLQDLGKYYCITEHKDRCVNCHEGNATVMNKDLSHQGLVAYPQKDNGAKCEECHAQDVEARLAKFASLGGYGEVVEVSVYTPHDVANKAFPESNPAVEKTPWSVGAFIFFGLWLVLIFFSPLKP
jgi:cytochrome c553